MSGEQGHMAMYLHEATCSRNLIAGLACFAWCHGSYVWKLGIRSRGEEGGG